MKDQKHFPAEISHLKNMIDFVKTSIPDFKVNFELALEEALVNICSYAYPDHDGTLLIVVEKREEEVCVTIIDEGIAYDPINYLKQAKKPDIGGLGIHLISKMAHKLHYERKEGKNILHLHFNVF